MGRRGEGVMVVGHGGEGACLSLLPGADTCEEAGGGEEYGGIPWADVELDAMHAASALQVLEHVLGDGQVKRAGHGEVRTARWSRGDRTGDTHLEDVRQVRRGFHVLRFQLQHKLVVLHGLPRAG
jgi:hypothetical protein